MDKNHYLHFSALSSCIKSIRNDIIPYFRILLKNGEAVNIYLLLSSKI